MEQFSGLLEASPDAVLVVDVEGVICRANRNVEDVLGYTPGELHGSPVETLLPETDRDRHVEYLEEYVESPEPRPFGSRAGLHARRADGTEIPVEVSLGPVESDGEQFVVAVVSDVSERRARKRALEDRNERLDEFTSVVSHDLRNPLNVAIGRLELAREECDSAHLEDVSYALGRMESLVDDLLVLARQGESLDDLEAVDLEELLEACWTVVETTAVCLEVETDRTILADRGRLAQVFENLFRNAVEHTSTGSETTIRVGPLPEGFFLEDDGEGISPEERDRVFEAGYSTGEDGTGIGLRIVAEIVDAHGWEVSVGESEGGGARFEFTGVDVVER